VAFLDSNSYPQKYSSFDCVLAVDAFTSIKTDYINAFEDLHQYQGQTKDWLFGYLSYDLKNDTDWNFRICIFFNPKNFFF
jgi:para-aminobenzoate synthetase component 1